MRIGEQIDDWHDLAQNMRVFLTSRHANAVSYNKVWDRLRWSLRVAFENGGVRQLFRRFDWLPRSLLALLMRIGLPITSTHVWYMHSVYLAVGSYRAETNPELPLSRWPLSRAVTVMLNEQLRMQLPSGVQLRQHVHANRNSTTLATNSTLSRYSGSAALCRQIHSETEDTTTTEIYLALNDRLWFGTTLAIAAQLYAYW